MITKLAKYGHEAFGLSPANQQFLATLLSYFNHTTRECFPSNESVKRGCGISADNLHKNKKVLIEAGLIKIYNKPMGDHKRHSGYVINIELIEARFAELERDEAIADTIEANESGEDLFSSEQEEVPSAFEQQEQDNPFEDVYEDVITPVEDSNIFDDVIELKNAVVAYAGSPSELQAKEWNSSLSTNNYIAANAYGKPMKRFYLRITQ